MQFISLILEKINIGKHYRILLFCLNQNRFLLDK